MFDWIPFYEELADKLLDYKDKPNKLAEIIYDNFDRKTEIKFLHDWDGSDFEVIDPFTIFSIFNRQNKNRHKILEKIREVFNINAETPTSFEGIALQNNLNAAFYCFKQDRSPDGQDINRLWTLFENIITMSNKIEEAFNAVLKQRYIAMPKLTMALSYIRPNNYLALDSNNVSYLEKHKLSPQEALDGGYSEYIKLLTNVRKKIATQEIKEQTFPEISEAAWKYGHNMASLDRKVWLFDAKYEPFESNEIVMGDSVQMSDFSQFKSKEALRKAYQEKKGNTDVSIPNAYWQFIKEVDVGDIIVVYDGVKKDKSVYHKLCGWGIFTSDIIFESGENARIKRKVEWKRNISNDPITCRETKNQLFFHEANSKQAQAIIKLLKIPEETTSIQPQENNNMEYQKYIDILKNCHNLVLTGAPGTGKTYLAREIAKQMNAETEFVQFHPSYDYSDFVEGLRPVQSADNQIGFERKDGIFKAFCAKALKNLQDSKKSIETLEKESSTRQIVEDFINDAIENNSEFATSGTKNKFKIIDNKENIFLIDVPANKTSTLSLSKSVIITLLNENKVINGGKDIQEHFERTYRTQQDSYYYVLLNEIKKVHKASQPSSKQKVESKNFVFIIDEINRGEVSKIFGELFYAIDPGYRNDGNGKDSVKTQYQNLVQEDDVFYKGFFVPSNVYIIATMNDIDRSVESMDFAMRRRFCWLEVKPEERKAMLERLGNFKNEAINRMDALNKAITNEESLGSAFQIGPAYFLKLKNGDFNTLWEMHLEPLLREYLRGFRNADEKLKTFKSCFELQQTSLTNNDITEG